MRRANDQFAPHQQRACNAEQRHEQQNTNKNPAAGITDRARAVRELPSASYTLPYLSTSGGLVQNDVGMMIDTVPISGIRPRHIDTLVIPGAPGIWALWQDAVLMKWIPQALLKARRVACP
jgi:hypothetical protein